MVQGYLMRDYLVPNIFTGGINFHSKNECVSIDSMEKCSKLIIKIAQKYTKR